MDSTSSRSRSSLPYKISSTCATWPARSRSLTGPSTTEETQVSKHLHPKKRLQTRPPSNNPLPSETKAFRTILAGGDEYVTSAQGATVKTHMSYADAMKRLNEIDILVIVGGESEKVLKTKSQPLTLIKAFTEQQKKNPARERTLMSVCTGSLFLGETGILSGLSATTHPDYMAKFEIICSNAAQRDMADRADVMDARYVVNNLRFDLGENEDENPYLLTKQQYREKRRMSQSGGSAPSSPIEERANGGRRASAARKGSISLKISNTRRESIIKRANLRLGGLRVLTSSGVLSGIDGALYLVGALVSEDAAEEVARVMCHKWSKGVVVDGTDV
jgi:putative intracellular protease/amidase